MNTESARDVLKSKIEHLPTEKLYEVWEASEKKALESIKADDRLALAAVREAIMNELEHRDPAAFIQWLDT